MPQIRQLPVPVPTFNSIKFKIKSAVPTFNSIKFKIKSAFNNLILIKNH